MFIHSSFIRFILCLLLIGTFSISFASNHANRSDRQNYALFLKDILLATPKTELDSLKNFTMSSYYKLSQQRILGDNKLKHLQVSLNLFNKQKYSLLLKSMISFEKTYGRLSSMGWHEYFHIHILEAKIANKKEISKQVLSLANSYIKRYKQNEMKQKNNHLIDYNLLFSFYRISMKYLLLNQNKVQLQAYLTAYQKLAAKINSQHEQAWSYKVLAEYTVSQGLRVTDNILSELSFVDQTDFKIFYSLKQSLESNSISILNTSEIRGYLSEKWDDYTPSLVNNLVYLSLLLEDEQNIRLYYSKFREMTSSLSSFNRKQRVYDLLVIDESLKLTLEEKLSSRVSLMYKIKNLSLDTLLVKDERLLLTHELEVILYEKRMKLLKGRVSSAAFLTYIENIPMFKFTKNLRQKLLSSFENALFKIYQKNPNIVVKSWNKLSLKSNLIPILKKDNQVILGRIFANNFIQNKDLYFSLLNNVDEKEIHKIEIYRQFMSKNWKRVISMVKSDDLIEEQIFKTIALTEMGLYRSSRAMSDKVLISGQKIPEQWKQDFFLNYIRVLKSTLSKVEYFKRLKKIKQSIFVGGAEMPRVKEYAAFELIGLNMTLKQSSFEENLKNVNIFLNNYPRSKFYSMMVLTRATILAQLKRIKESTEAIQEVITKTTDKKIKIEALNELAILKIR